MRVALVVHCYFPGNFYGTEAYTRAVARELKALGHEPTIVSANFAGEPRQDQLITRYEVDQIPVFQIDRNFYPNQCLKDTFSLPYLRFIYERLFRHIRPEVVHICHLINHTTSLLEVTRALALPTFATFTDFFGVCFTSRMQGASGRLCAGPDPRRSNCIECAMSSSRDVDPAIRVAAKPALRPLVAKALARRPALAGRWRSEIEALIQRPGHLHAALSGLAAAIAPSRFLQQTYLRNGFDRPLELSPFGVDIDRSPKPVRGGEQLRVGFIGQLAEHKGVHLLVEAVRRLSDPRIEVEIWGDETQVPSYAARLRALAEGHAVAFRGIFPVERIADTLAGMDVLVIPSTWYENSPLILLQALATHTPVIVSDVDGLTEFVDPGVTGFCFRTGDAADLARVLAVLAGEPGRAARMSRTTRYDRTSLTMVEDILGLYRRRLPERGPRGLGTYAGPTQAESERFQTC